MSFEIRAITDDEAEAFVNSIMIGFGDQVHDGEADRLRQGLGIERTRAAFDDSRIVGTSGAYGFQMAVPGGGDVACAGLTAVTVAATHRRRGILNQLINAHFEDAVSRGEVISALWASEAAIYGRYGYGQANENVAIEHNTKVTDLRPPAEVDSFTMVSAEEARELFPAVHEQSRANRPGLIHRTDKWWDVKVIPDHEWNRHGASPRRYVVARRGGEPVGYVTYRQDAKWTDQDLPDGVNKLVEIVAVDTRAEHSLWWYLSNIDLFPNVSIWSQPVDTMLPWLARNLRGLKRLVTDGIHVRVLDIEAALSTRRYDSAGELVFSTVDTHRPELTGTYRLSVDESGVGTCTRSDDEPAVAISPQGLGSMYLGSAPVAGLRLGGHVEADDANLDLVRKLFIWPVAPWCNEGF